MQNELEEAIKRFSEVKRVFSKIGTAEIATDPMPPSVADIFIIIKPQSEWSGKYRNKEELIAAMEKPYEKCQVIILSLRNRYKCVSTNYCLEYAPMLQ